MRSLLLVVVFGLIGASGFVLAQDQATPTPTLPPFTEFDLQAVPFDTISRISWNKQQDKIAVGRLNGLVEIWNTSNGQRTATLIGHTQAVIGIDWSHNGSRLATSSTDKTVRIWDANNGQSLFTLVHADEVNTVGWAIDDSRLFSNIELPPDNLYVWDATNGHLISQSSGGGASVRLNSDGSKLLYLRSRNNVEIWDTSTVMQINRYSQPDSPGGDLTGGAWIPNSSQFATGTLNGLVKVWNASTGVITNILQANTTPDLGPFAQMVLDVKYNPDGSLLSCVSSDGSIKVWTTSTWEIVKTLQLPETVSDAAFSPDATRLAYASNYTQIVVAVISLPSHATSYPSLTLFTPPTETPQ